MSLFVSNKQYQTNRFLIKSTMITKKIQFLVQKIWPFNGVLQHRQENKKKNPVLKLIQDFNQTFFYLYIRRTCHLFHFYISLYLSYRIHLFVKNSTKYFLTGVNNDD